MFRSAATLLLLTAAPALSFLATPSSSAFRRTSPSFIIQRYSEPSGSSINSAEVAEPAAEEVAAVVEEVAEEAPAVAEASEEQPATLEEPAISEEPKEEREKFSAFVGNVAFTATVDSIRALFSQHGEVIFVTLPRDRNSGNARGFAFVSMKTKEDLDSVVKNLDGVELEGRPLRVVESLPRGETKPARKPTRDDSKKLYVGNLSFDTTKEHLTEFMSEFGTVTDVYMPTNSDGNPRGFAFVSMKSEDAENAIEQTNGYNFMGRTITVSPPLPPGEKSKRQKEAGGRTKLYVGNLSFYTIADTLAELFEEFGTVYDCYLPEDPVTGSSRGFGFVSMDKEAAKVAVEETDGCELDGRIIRVNEALPRGQQQEQDDSAEDEGDDEF